LRVKGIKDQSKRNFAFNAVIVNTLYDEYQNVCFTIAVKTRSVEPKHRPAKA